MLKIFGLNGSFGFAQEVAKHLNVPISSHTESRFDDGEIYIRSDENVRGSDVYVIHSLYSDDKMVASEKLATLLFFVNSLKDASAGRITVICPYVSFRQDRKTESRAPIITKYIAKHIECAGADRFLTMDIHNLSALQNAFRIPTDNLEARNLMADYLTGINREGNVFKTVDLPKNLVMLSPDSGGMPRTRHARQAFEKRLKIEIPIVYVDKERIGGEVFGSKIVGDVQNKNVIIIDDIISSGSTINMAVKVVNNYGGNVYAVCATHGLFIGKANEYLNGIKIVITDTIPPFRLKDHNDLHVVSTAKMFALAIERTHKDGGSISDLLEC